MPYLGDFLGNLMSEVTIARMQSDLESVRIAELYASHPLLRTMPIPRIRLPEVELNVPVVVKGVDDPGTEGSARGGLKQTDINKAFQKALTASLREAGVRLSAANKKALTSALEKKAGGLTGPREVAVGVGATSNAMVSATVAWLGQPGRGRPPLEAEPLEKLESHLKSTAFLELLKVQKPPPRLDALVKTTEVREAGPEEVLTHLKLKLSENAMEWTMVELDGETTDRLIPE